MREIISVRGNEYFTKKKDKYSRYMEMVILFAVPKYKFTNRDDIVNEVSIEESRFVVNEKSLKGLILSLIAFLDEDLAEEIKDKLTDNN